ncbi:MAG: PIG-L family deacetylase, partial [Planctomycetota bacterium]
ACDIFLITNGEGGFKYATLAESIYGVELTQEGPGRWYLPSIRRMELLAACKVLHVRNVWFMTQRDHRYTQDPLEVLGADAEVWDIPYLKQELAHVLEAGDYDFVLTFAPSATTHGHHQAATVLAVQAVAALPAQQRPVLLGARVETAEIGVPTRPESLADFPETAIVASQPALVFDRLEKFGHRDALDYRIVVNWAIGMHRSQGTMQLAMSQGLREHSFLFEANAPGAAERAVEWFAALATPQFEAKQYGSSAGTNAGTEADAGAQD